MAGIFEKLNLGDRQELVVLNPPESFLPELSRLPVIHLHRHLTAVTETGFLQALVTRKAEVDALAGPVAARAAGDATVWFAYPKSTSKKFQCDKQQNRPAGPHRNGD